MCLKENVANPIEKLHVKFMKEILGVNCKTSNEACRAELARLPMSGKISSAIIGFYNHLISDENTLSYNIYRITKNTNPWTIKVHKLLNSLGFSFLINKNDLLEVNMKHVKLRIKDILMQKQNSNLKSNSKLSFFLEVYKLGERPFYVDKLINLTDRSMICRLKTSSHQLMIEKGRHLQIPTTERICPICNISVEDELHFLFNCSGFNSQRDIFNNKISSICKTYTNLSNKQKLNIIFNRKLYCIMKMSSNFISDCLEIRKSKI